MDNRVGVKIESRDDDPSTPTAGRNKAKTMFGALPRITVATQNTMPTRKEPPTVGMTSELYWSKPRVSQNTGLTASHNGVIAKLRQRTAALRHIEIGSALCSMRIFYIGV